MSVLKHTPFICALAPVLSLALSGAAHAADTVFDDDVIVQSDLCVGSAACVDGISLAEDIVIKSGLPSIRFDDTDASTKEWILSVDDLGAGPAGNFSFLNITDARRPLVIEPTTPTNTLYLDNAGYVGMGTSLPETDLHIATAATPSIRLHHTSGADQRWDISANQGSLFIVDVNEGTFPFVIDDDAPSNALRVTGNGFIGLGTAFPQAQLELSTTNSFNFFRITATGAAVNDSVDITFTGGPLGTGQLRYNIVDGDNQEMSLDANGNMVIDGTLTTAGPTCAGGCDRVFEADYALPTISDHAKAMFRLGHLPSVSATQPGAPVNVTEKMGEMLNALEHAHIYIAQQDVRLDRALAEINSQRRSLETQAQTLAVLQAQITGQSTD